VNLKELIFGGRVTDVDGDIGNYPGSVQSWLPVKNIAHGVVITKDNRFVKIIETMPVNFRLKTQSEQRTVIQYFASWLKIAPDNIQIRVLTQKLDVDGYVAKMKEYLNAEDNENCRAMIENNISEVSRIAESEVTTHRFFIVFEYEPQRPTRNNTVRAIADKLNEEADTARRYLELCGLEVLQPEYMDNASLELLYQIMNKRAYRRVPLPDGVFDMVTDVHGVYGAG
jgi:type IV secretory pathway VirB4 component